MGRMVTIFVGACLLLAAVGLSVVWPDADGLASTAGLASVITGGAGHGSGQADGIGIVAQRDAILAHRRRYRFLQEAR